jgi:hypothetical protein
MELVAVAAVADNLVIGAEGDLPWGSLPEDKQRYRERVADDPVILGRRTFELMADDLPGRAQIVLSRTEREYPTDTAYHAGSVDAAIAVEVKREVIGRIQFWQKDSDIKHIHSAVGVQVSAHRRSGSLCHVALRISGTRE